jgi:type II secretory pathway component GspD/PulD (secretin)
VIGALLALLLASNLITIDVHDVDLSDVIALLAAQSGRNIVTDDTVKEQRVTIHLRDVTFDRALAVIASADGLVVHRSGDVLIVGSAPAATPAPSPPPERTRPTKAYKLEYVKADDAIKALKILTADGTYVADGEHNTAIIAGNDAVQNAAATLFATIDRPSPQVLFEVKVADVTPQNDSSNFGVELGGVSLQGAATSGAASYAFASGRIPVNVTLNALISQGRAQILATPKLVTLNNREADLLIGETYPVVTTTSVLGGQNVQFVDIGVKLRLTPTIGEDGVVTAELHPEYSEIEGVTSTGYPIITNRKIDSTLRVSDADTIVLGGLLRDVSNETITKIPGLSDVPILGKFFQNKQAAHERDEIVFLITPHVIYPAGTSAKKP